MTHSVVHCVSSPAVQRQQLQVAGLVQGVGFRPFVYTLATSLSITGWIKNTQQGVLLDIEGSASQLEQFRQRLQSDKPLHAMVQQIEVRDLKAVGYQSFEIHHSSAHASSSRATAQNGQQKPSALILPDLATCPACLAELFDKSDRRYRYPFINCTHCGPRFSIVRSLPYDRHTTTMAGFQMCPQCQQEYDDPRDRRFHAQPTACPDCGPQVEFWDAQGHCVTSRDDALRQAVQAIRSGQIVAVKGLGGFHLIVDATNNTAVTTLRQRKHRPHKPFAVMYPSLDVLNVQCQVSADAAELLQSAIAPIVLLPVVDPTHPFPLATAINPGNPFLGVMLPYTPLHHLLLQDLGTPVVATSGNRSGAPLCCDNHEAVEQLGTIADGFLMHNRPIHQPVDDSIVRFVLHQPTVFRRARGYAPLPIIPPPSTVLANHQQDVILAVGGHLKNTVALYVHGKILVSQHLGDLDNVQGCDRFQSTIRHLCDLYEVEPTIIAHDAHPDYHSTQFAKEMGIKADGLKKEERRTKNEEIKAEGRRQKAEIKNPNTPTPQHPFHNPQSTIHNPQLLPVQHHYAHLLSGLADNQWVPPAFGLTWDGTGYGLDQTIWGGEVLWVGEKVLQNKPFERVGHLRPFLLPGGEMAVKDPRRSALGLLYECFGDRAFEILVKLPLPMFTLQEINVLKPMMQRELNSPRTSSMGRLFDGISALINCCRQVSFEGQAAMALEFAVDRQIDAVYPYGVIPNSYHQLPQDQPLQFDYEPMITAIINDLHKQISISTISATFHNTLIAGFAQIMQTLSHSHPETKQIVLTGGCFQNCYLLEGMVKALKSLGFSVGWHHQIPPNDGGIALGQIMAALREIAR